MEVKKIVHEIEQSPIFKDWKAEHAKSYLAHVFFDEDNQAGYFDPQTEMITTFFMRENVISKSEEAEVFRQDTNHLRELSIENIHFTPEQALHLAKSLQEKHHSHEMVFKQFCILQHLDIGEVYNITLVTQSMKTFNFKISAEKGTLLKTAIDSLMDMTRVG